MKGRKILSIIIVLSLLISIIPFHVSGAETVKVTILETSDLHGYIYPYDYFTSKSAEYGLAKVATLIKTVKKENPNAILLDNGDTIQGAPIAYYFDKIDTSKIHPMMLSMNTLGYQAMTLGNHEFNYGLDILNKARNEAKFPWLSANIYKEDGTNYFTPYIILTVSNVKIGILSLTTKNIPGWENPENIKGLVFKDTVEEAKKWVPILKEKEKCDVVVLLTHQGFEKDIDTGKDLGTAYENQAYQICMEVPNIDVILTGHSHLDIANKFLNGVLIAQPSYWGRALSRVDITLEKTDTGFKVIKKEGVNLKVDEKVIADEEILNLIKPYHEATLKYVEEPIGGAASDFIGKYARLEDSAILDLIHKVQMKTTGVDLSIAAMLPSVSPDFLKGPIKVKDIYSLYIYENTLYVIEVTGQQIKDALELSAKYYNTYTFSKTEDPLVNPLVRHYNFDSVEGASYVMDITKPVGQRIKNLTYHGSPMSMTRKYKLAINNYRAAGGGGYSMFVGAPILYRSKDEIRNLIIDYVKEEKVIYPEVNNNWFIVPDYLKHWALENINTLYRRGTVSGYPDGRFIPDNVITRAEYAAFVVRSFDIVPWSSGDPPTFKDTPKTYWAYPYIEAIYRSKLSTGYPDLTFKPQEEITREQAAVILVKALGYSDDALKVSLDVLNVFKDKTEISDWAKPYVAFGVSKGYLKGFEDNTIKPKKSLSRAEMAKILNMSRFPSIVVLHTNDFHGNLEPLLDANKKPYAGSARIATLVNSFRSRFPTSTLLLDAGDAVQGTSVSNIFEGKPVIEVYNAMKYDVMTLGNHEFDFGIKPLEEIIAQAQFPILSANIFKKGTSETFVNPSIAIDISGVKIGIFGLTAPELQAITHPKNVETLDVKEVADISKTMVDNLKGQGANLVIALSHIGFGPDKTLASTVSGIDLIVGGHSHTILDKPTTVSSTYIVQTGEWGKNLGRVLIDIAASKNKATIKEIFPVLVPVSGTITEDKTIKDIVDGHASKLKEQMSVVIGEALVALDGERANVRTKETNLGNFITDWMRQAMGGDIALTNGGGIRASIPKGNITVGDIFKVLPFNNINVLLELSGKDIKEALELSVSLYPEQSGGFLQVSGLTFKFDPKKPKGSRVVEILVAGKPIEMDKKYKAVTNDFTAAGGDGYTVFKNAKVLYGFGEMMRDGVIKYIKENPKVEPKVEGRIIPIP